MRKVVAMLKQVECADEVYAGMEVVRVPQPRKRPVWVYSKSQAPYEFRPWMDPCSPHEWPYNLQVLRGTADYDDILAWYCERSPQVTRDDLRLLVDELIRCAGDRQISVEIYHDIDTQERSPTFQVWGFEEDASDEEDRVMADFDARCLANPRLIRLLLVVEVTTRWGAFENRHLSDWR